MINCKDGTKIKRPCERCQKELNNDYLHIRMESMSTFRDGMDKKYIKLCGACKEELFDWLGLGKEVSDGETT